MLYNVGNFKDANFSSDEEKLRCFLFNEPDEITWEEVRETNEPFFTFLMRIGNELIESGVLSPSCIPAQYHAFKRRVELVHKINGKHITSYSLTNSIVHVPKCHDEPTMVLTKHITMSTGGTLDTDIAIIRNGCTPLLLREDDKYSVVYYSSKDEKMNILLKLADSYMDRFCEYAPTPDCPENKIVGKINELRELILKLDSD